MVAIFECKHCGFESDGWMGPGNYVVTDKGERVMCNSPYKEFLDAIIQKQ